MLKQLTSFSLLFVVTASHAQINKCTVDGKVQYQATPCPGVSQTVNLSGAGKANPTSPATNYYKKEAARLAHTERINEAIALRKVLIGMTEDELVQSWGNPSKKNKTMSASGTSEQWVYYRRDIGDTQYVYVTNGVVTTVQSP